MTTRESLLVECSGASREAACDVLPRRSRRLDSLRNINEKTMEPLPAYIVGDYVIEKGRRPYDHRVPGQPARSWAGAKEWWEVRRRASRARPDVAASIGKEPLYVGDTLRECLCWIEVVVADLVHGFHHPKPKKNLDRQRGDEYREALRKIANCLGCPACRDVARAALGVTHQEFVGYADIHGNPPKERTS